MKEKFLIQTSDIKKKAKQLKREKSLKHHRALDEAAKHFGFSNYKNYQNESEALRKELDVRLEVGALFVMDEQDRKMAERLKTIDPAFENFNVPIPELINAFSQNKHTDEAVQAICEKETTLKEYLEMFFLKDSLENVDWDLVTIAPQHIPQKASLKNLVYKFGKNAFDEETDTEEIFIEGEFELKCEIMFEHSQEDLKNCTPGFFDDQILFGSFELTVGRDKEITIEEQDIGFNW